MLKQYQKDINNLFGILLQRNGKYLEGLRVINNTTFGFFENKSDKALKTFNFNGYVSPTIGSPFLSEERQFNLMFRSQLGPVDSIGDIISFVKKNKDLNSKKLVGMHWGTVVLSLEPIMEPAQRFKKNASKFGYHENDATLFKIGEAKKISELVK